MQTEAQRRSRHVRAGRKCRSEAEWATLSFNKNPGSVGSPLSATLGPDAWVRCQLLPWTNHFPALSFSFMNWNGVILVPTSYGNLRMKWADSLGGWSIEHSCLWQPNGFSSACWWQNWKGDPGLFTPSPGLFPWHHPRSLGEQRVRDELLEPHEVVGRMKLEL